MPIQSDETAAARGAREQIEDAAKVPRQAVSNQLIRAADLGLASRVASNKVYESCRFIGPAILAPISGTSFVGCAFEGDADAVLWEVPEERDLIVGAIGLINCDFRDCVFTEVGIAGKPEFIAQFRQSLSAS